MITGEDLIAESRLREDLDLLISTAREAGALAMQYWKRKLKSDRKADGSLVTEADIAVNALLASRLRVTRPGYGWLSEEGPDDPDRLARDRVWVLDPIDGTTVFFRGAAGWTVALALVEHGRPVAAAVYNAVSDEMYSARQGGGAWRNGDRIFASRRTVLEAARIMASDGILRAPIWREPWPPMTLLKIPSLAHRLALVASGEADAACAITPRSEWDLAAGVLLVEEAGGAATAADGSALRFNQPVPRAPSFLASGRNLHKTLVDRLTLGLKEGPQRAG